VFHVHRPQRRRVRTGISRPIRGGGFGWFRPLVLVGMIGPLLAAGANLPTVSLSVVSAQPQMVAAQPAYPQAGQESALDDPLRMIAAARQSYQQVIDYQCILISQERVSNKLLPQNVIQMSFRKNPFSVYMKWLGPKEKEGQEVCYVQGKNQNKMRVRAAGSFAGSLGFIPIDVNDPKVKQNSRHAITEAGLGNLIERVAKSWEAERNLNKTQVNIAEYEYNKKRCIRVETMHREQHPSFYAYRCVIYFDKETWLPVRTESYDWPRQGGPAEGELLECFSYIDMRTNVGLQDGLFNK
jgi:hypothetical protein